VESPLKEMQLEKDSLSIKKKNTALA